MQFKKRLSVCLAFILCIHASAQWTRAIYNVPATIPPSPTSTALGKYGAWPVSNYTGTPQISIPLYEIKSGSINVPVSLSYHASGIQVEEMAAWTGLGWSLNAGGVITRTVAGAPDESLNGYANMNSGYKGNSMPSSFDPQNNMTDLYQFNRFVTGQYDCEPDIYCFNFNGRSGKFYLDANNNFVPVNCNQLKITHNPILNGVTGNNAYWEIVDEEGLTYTFGYIDGKESSYVRDAEDGMHLYYRLGTVVTAWYLNRIISADKRDTISFSYTAKNESYAKKGQQVLRLAQNISNVQIAPGTSWNDLGYGYKESIGDEFHASGNCQLSAIDWKFGKVTFTANTARTDMAGKALDNIAVTGKDNSKLKAWGFVYNYVNSRLFLKELDCLDSANAQVNNYKFDYYTGLPLTSSNAQDYWGYYNGATNSNLIVNEPAFSQFAGYMNSFWNPTYANREVNPAYITAGTLNKITFPTGGYTQFEFEANEYLYIGDGYAPGSMLINPAKTGGIRVKSIKNYSNDNALAEERSFRYDQGVLYARQPTFSSVAYQQIYGACMYSGGDQGGAGGSGYNGYPSTYILTSTPYSTAALGNTQGSNVGYAYVTEYFKGGSNGKVMYNYTTFYDEWNDVNFNAMFQPYGRPAFLPSTSNDYKRGMLLQQNTYKTSGSDTSLVEAIINTYDYGDTAGKPHYQDLRVLKVKSTGDSLLACILVANPTQTYWNIRSWLFAYGFYTLKSVWPKLVSAETRSYDGTDPTKYTAVIKNLFYDNINHLNQTRTETKDSRGKTLKTEYKYPNEMVTQGLDPNGAYQQMLNRNILNDVIEQKSSVDGALTERIRQNYSAAWATDQNIIKPANVEVETPLSATEQRLIYQSYDNDGNIKEVSKKADMHTCYIYDYKNDFPVAEIKNATQVDIAYTSFEAEGAGNWTIPSAARNTGSGITGKLSYSLASGSISKSGLSSGKTYIVSYWSSGGSYSVTGSTAVVTGRTVSINGVNWTCYEHTVTGTASVTIAGSGYIDEVRLYPSTAQMTTYTYLPLIGMTSQCDAANHITYYVYDSFGRLKLVRDQDNNLIKKFDYQYQVPYNQ